MQSSRQRGYTRVGPDQRRCEETALCCHKPSFVLTVAVLSTMRLPRTAECDGLACDEAST